MSVPPRPPGGKNSSRKGSSSRCAPKALEHREAQRDQRNQRQQRGIYQSVGAQCQLATDEVADDGVGITRYAQQPPQRVLLQALRPEQQTVGEGPQLLHILVRWGL